MPELVYIGGLLFVAAMLAVGAWLLVRAVSARTLPTVLDGVRVEVTSAVAVEDRVLEILWEVPLILTNVSRRPRTVPSFAGRAEVRSGRVRYMAEIVTEQAWALDDGRALELNPAGTAIGGVWVTLPAGETPGVLAVRLLAPREKTLTARLPAR